jgi:hypothetical protein
MGFRQVGVKGRHVRSQGHGLANHLDRARVISPLMAQDAKQVQDIGVLLVLGQDRLVQKSGPLQLAGLVRFEGRGRIGLHGKVTSQLPAG